MTYYTAIDLTDSKVKAGQLVDRLMAASAEIAMHLPGTSAYMIVKTPKEVNAVVWAQAGLWASGSYDDADQLLAIAKATMDLQNHRNGLPVPVSNWGDLGSEGDS